MGTILIVDDMEDMRRSLSNIVKNEGYSVLTAGSGKGCLEKIKGHIIDLVFLDIGLPDSDGIQLIPVIKNIRSDIDIIMITGVNEAKSAVESLQEGAIDYLVKPFDIIEFKSIMNRVMQSKSMWKKAQLRQQQNSLNTIIFSSKIMQPVQQTIEMAAEVNASVLITGETGTGKELVAQAIHEHGLLQNKGGVFVKVDCGTLSENLIESELFGYDKGAFTDATKDKKGLVEMANGGTLFLDEIGNLPISLQPKLLRLIEDSTFRKVGGLKDIQVQLRIIAATNCDIEQEIGKGLFREDLYYRLNVIPIPLPPLRDRAEDILLLANYFLLRFKTEMRKDIKGFTPGAHSAMRSHQWAGNVRELKNLIEREVIFCKDEWLTMSCLQPENSIFKSESDSILPLKEMEKQYILEVLHKSDNNKSKAARLLGISRTTLREKL